MNNIYSVNESLIETISHFFKKNDSYIIRKWTNRIVRVIQNFSQQGQQNSQLTIFITANSVLFICNNLLANWLERRIQSCPKKLDERNRRFNHFLINGLIFGSSTLTLNVILSQMMQYPLSRFVKAALIVTTLAARHLWSTYGVSSQG